MKPPVPYFKKMYLIKQHFPRMIKFLSGSKVAKVNDLVQKLWSDLSAFGVMYCLHSTIGTVVLTSTPFV